MSVAGREPSLGELAEDILEVKEMVQSVVNRLDQHFVRKDVYEARHTALRDQVALELAGVRTELQAVRTDLHTEATSIRQHADGARALALWAFGVLAVAVIGAVVAFLAQSAT